MPLAATRVYEMSFFTGFGVSALIYYTLNRFFPARGANAKWEEVDVSSFNDSASVRASVSDGSDSIKSKAGDAVENVYKV